MTKTLPKTEQIYPYHTTIDEMSTSDAFDLMLKDQSKVIEIINREKLNIVYVINEMYKHLERNKNGRLIYCGAGTSGRIAVQDGAELNPTFGWKSKQFNFLIAGGEKALSKSIENAEDNKDLAHEMFKKVSVTNKDIIICLAASGNTPFTNEILKLASKKGALTLAISNNPDGKILMNSKMNLILDTEQEVVAGSTRLKAGTSQKICLNIISTLLMTKLGKVKNGMMIELIANNEKLVQRKKIINKILS